MKKLTLIVMALVAVSCSATDWSEFDATKPADNRRWDKADDDIRTNFAALDARIGSNYATFDVTNALYGAVGDGSTDDEVAIEAAITAAAVNGGTVFFPATGNAYKFLTAITVPLNVGLMFAPGASMMGDGSSTLTLSGILIDTMHQVFQSTMTVAGMTRNEFIRPEWFGTNTTPPPVDSVVGATDMTAAIQAAIDALHDDHGGTINLSGRYYTTTALTCATSGYSLRFQGSVPAASLIFNDSSDIFTFSTGTTKLHIEGLQLKSFSGGGHIFEQLGTVSQMLMLDCQFVQANTDKSIWNASGSSDIFIDNMILHCISTISASATVPGWNMDITAGGCNTNTWQGGVYNNSGVGMFFIGNQNDHGSSAQYGNVFRDIDFEQPLGGAIKIESGRNTTIENCKFFDMGGQTTTDDLIHMANPATGTKSQHTTIKNLLRLSGTLGSGLFDIKLDSNTSSLDTIIGCSNAGGSGMAIDLGNNSSFRACNAATYTNDSGAYFDFDGGGAVGINQPIKTAQDIVLTTLTLMKTIDVDAAGTDDFVLDNTAEDQTQQNLNLGAIIPKYASIDSYQLRCLEATSSGTMGIEIGTTSSGAEIAASADVDALNEIGGTAAAGSPIVVATNGIRNLWMGFTPSVDWDTLTAGRWVILVTYTDWAYAYTAKGD